MSYVALGSGTDVPTYNINGISIKGAKPIGIEDIARQSGLYLLGRPGMGKSALSIFIALQDIRDNLGVFFLDPHGDAIVDLTRRLYESDFPDGRGGLERVYLFDFENENYENYSFGINLLACKNVASLNAREVTYNKAYNVFYKLWEEHWGVWLQLILQNILRAFIENPGYTLADVPMFLNLRNEDFRNHIIDNIKYNPAVAEFWRYEFFDSKRRDQVQQERVDSALTRINTLLTTPYVRHIIGQQETTIDFEKIVSSNEIFLFRIAANFGEDTKKFIGTILLSELLHAVRARREGARDQFSIFIDEFHNFASNDNMATMITEGRKFGVATTLMHVERFGQLANNPKLMGATAAIVNKVLFQLTVKDAEEFAPEFAKSVEPMETRREQELVLSPHAVEDIWERGHPYQYIMDIRNSYFWIVDLLKQSDKQRLSAYAQIISHATMDRHDAIHDVTMTS